MSLVVSEDCTPALHTDSLSPATYSQAVAANMRTAFIILVSMVTCLVPFVSTMYMLLGIKTGDQARQYHVRGIVSAFLVMLFVHFCYLLGDIR